MGWRNKNTDDTGHRTTVHTRTEQGYNIPVKFREAHCIEAGCGWVGLSRGVNQGDAAERDGEGHGRDTRR